MKILNKKGMTLVEVIVSALILGLVVVSVVATIAQSSVFSRRIDHVYTSSNLAKKRLDDLKRYLVSDLAARATETDVRIDSNGDLDVSGDYIRTTAITEDYDGNPYLIKVKVSVDRYADGAAYGSPAVIETLFADVE
ncbi:MAG: prepilin-type N-terminal cleavage/methylation domain-containing protein [Candidatus Omnitrophota bacterium]